MGPAILGGDDFGRDSGNQRQGTRPTSQPGPHRPTVQVGGKIGRRVWTEIYATPLMLTFVHDCHQDRPENLVLEVFFRGSGRFGCLTGWFVAAGFVFLVFFGIN